MRILFSRTFAIALVLVLTATGLWAGGEEEAAAATEEREMVRDPATGEMVLAPRYGGSISYAARAFPPSSDPWFTHHANPAMSGVNEKLAIGDWALDRKIFDYRSDVTPSSAFKGWLAESWEMPDQLTMVFTLRDDVFWHDKPPVNGRKLTARDVEYTYHRILGNGSGFTEPSPAQATAGQFGPVTALDDRRVEFKFTRPVREPLIELTHSLRNTSIIAPEVIQQHGDVQDYRNNVGTGPFQLVDWVEDSTMTWERVDDYWGFDEKFPENRLPYIDSVLAVLMKESAAHLAAMRTRKIDFLGAVGTSQISSIDDIDSLQASNPELQYYERLFRAETVAGFAVTKEPFSDIRVRRAMQMALDLETMNNDYFKGRAEWKPEGAIGLYSGGYHTPFEQWPAEIQGYYSYDPEGAERLLDEAGYPRGDDGIRLTVPFDVWEGRDLGFFELQAAYWRDIGVSVEINPMEGATYVAFAQSGAAEGMTSRESGFTTGDPAGTLRAVSYTDATWNIPAGSDPKLDELIDAAASTVDVDEYTRLSMEADRYLTELHWFLWSPRVPQYFVMQPWIVGYNGELRLGFMDRGPVIFARLWIDDQLRDEYVN
ncbi:MAG: ABC transporter substrate-binding protein [Spirochaetaceae bacterium]|nr:ABC transporter substrate-binding protein [Spirochaetaceae bacterium]